MTYPQYMFDEPYEACRSFRLQRDIEGFAGERTGVAWTRVSGFVATRE